MYKPLIKLPFASLRIPFTESQPDTIIFQRPARFTRIGDRFELVTLFDFRSTAKFLEKALICCINPFEFFLNGLTRQRIPMWVCRSFQIRQVSRHGIVVRIRQPVFISLTLPFMEIRMHLPHIVKQVAKSYRIRLTAELILIGFHGISSIKSLTPAKWVGRHVALQLRFACLPT